LGDVEEHILYRLVTAGFHLSFMRDSKDDERERKSAHERERSEAGLKPMSVRGNERKILANFDKICRFSIFQNGIF
jgi:hypothetical protein